MAQDNANLDRLKQKYQPVLNLMQQLRVQLQNLNMQGSQLLLRGVAPTADAKNKIWDQIKLVDKSYSDLICDITVTQQQSQTMTAGASVGDSQGRRRYTVQAGDTLSKISREYYGDPNEYMKIYNANRSVLKDPNTIRPGQELVIPD